MSHLSVITPPSFHPPVGPSLLLLGNPVWREDFIASLLTTSVTDLYHIPDPLGWKEDWPWVYFVANAVDGVILDGDTVSEWELIFLAGLKKPITVVSNNDMWVKVGKSYTVVNSHHDLEVS